MAWMPPAGDRIEEPAAWTPPASDRIEEAPVRIETAPGQLAQTQSVVMGRHKNAEQAAQAIAAREEPTTYDGVMKAMFPRSFASQEAGIEPDFWTRLKDTWSFPIRQVAGTASGGGAGIGALWGGGTMEDAMRAGAEAYSEEMASPGATPDRGNAVAFTSRMVKDPMVPVGIALGGLPAAGALGGRLLRAAEGTGMVLGRDIADAGSSWVPESITPGQVALAGAAGVLPEALGFGGMALGKKWFPGINAGTNRNVPEDARELVAKNLDEVLSPGFFPRTRGGFLDLAEKQQRKLGALYERALEAVPESWAIMTDDIAGRFRENLRQRLGSRSALGYNAETGEAVLPNAAENAMQSVMDRVRGAQAFRGKMTELTEARDLSKLMNDLTNPETWRDPVGDVAMLKKDVGKAFHGGVNDVLMSAEPYASTLGKDTPRQYALWSSVDDLVDKPGRLGLADRLPVLNVAVSPWLKSSSAYKVGQLARQAGIISPYWIHASKSGE